MKTVNKSSSMFVIVVILFICLNVVFRARAYDDKSIDEQVILRLTAWGAAAAITLLCGLPRLISNIANSAHVVFLFVFLLYTIINSVFLSSGSASIAAATSLIIIFAFTLQLYSVAGIEFIVKSYVFAVFMICAASIPVYILVPSLGRMSEWVGNLHIPGDRMSGIAGSPNGLGGLASSALLLIYLYKTKLSNGSLLKLMLMTTIILVCLVASNSRSALGILLLSIYIHILLNNTKIFALITILVLAASNVILLVGVEEFLSSVSRSASAADLATGTGRTLIWSTVLRLSSERPIFGWGFGSSIEILPKQPELFALAAHAHNMYLQILLTVGFVGLFLFVLANLFVFRSAVLSGDHKMLSIFAFHQLIGLTESGTVGSLAGMTYVHYLIPFVCLNLHCGHSSSDFTRKARLQ